MHDISKEVLKKINDYGYEAYIVGGFVRDYLLGITSKDVDINTNATPKDLKEIFKDATSSNNKYGSVTLYYKNYRFEITTFRIEDDYLDNRHPNVVFYTTDLKKDLLRRDFTINTFCMDQNGVIIDLLNAKGDLNNRVIKSVVDSNVSFGNDALRILRAIRFATVLNFSLDDEVIKAIKKNKELLRNLSYERKKYELDRIFGSKYASYGIKLLKELELVDVLELKNIERVIDYSDMIGIWAMINPSNYPFNKSERELIKNINKAYELDNLDVFVLYKYGLYINTLAGVNKKISKKDIITKYQSLPINSKSDIKIDAPTICKVLNKETGAFIKKIYDDLEKQILLSKIKNEEQDIINYIRNNYWDYVFKNGKFLFKYRVRMKLDIFIFRLKSEIIMFNNVKHVLFFDFMI